MYNTYATYTTPSFQIIGFFKIKCCEKPELIVQFGVFHNIINGS